MLRSELPAAPNRAFSNGLLTGLSIAAVVVHAWFAVLLAPLRETYADIVSSGIGGVPCLTELVVHPAWLWGVPAVGVALVIALIVTRPARRGPYLACALLLLATVTATWVLSQTPLRELAGDIKSDHEMQLTPVGP
jgi:hypothetical protein